MRWLIRSLDTVASEGTAAPGSTTHAYNPSSQPTAAYQPEGYASGGQAALQPMLSSADALAAREGWPALGMMPESVAHGQPPMLGASYGHPPSTAYSPSRYSSADQQVQW